MFKRAKATLGIAVLTLAIASPDWNPLALSSDSLSGAAEARGGRTPAGVGSVGVGTAGHGVARRSTRRAVVATGAYVATVPAGCPIVQVNGSPLYYCGGVYYQASNGQYAVVHVD